MSPHPARVRLMEARDAGEVARLSGELGYPASPPEIAARLSDLASRPGNAVFVAELSPEELAGWIHVSEDATLTDALGAEIRALVVDARRRSRGIGRDLVAQAERWAIARGCRTLGVHCRTEREGAHRFYRTRGFTLRKTQHVFERPVAR